ncbi:2-methylthioadenine synthetase, partial [Candidatus Woesearchaeota archaeon]
LKQLPGYVPKERSRLLTRVFNDIAFKNNLKWLGWEGRVIIDEQGNYGNWKGRNFAYKQVVINSDQDLLGKTPFVKVFDVSSHDLKAKVVQRA